MKTSLTDDNISKLLIKLTLPMVLGMFSMMAFYLADTYFVSNLGTDELSAISFTFPVITIIGSISLGLTTGASSVIARAIGEGDVSHVKKLTTGMLLLVFLIGIVFTIAGLLTINPLFKFLGASSELIPIIDDYMSIWYFGILFFIIPMVGNGVIRATGDTKSPGMIMSFAALLNFTLDPVFIFGFYSIPGMGIKGAAIASLVSRFISFSASLYILLIRKKIISFKLSSFSEVVLSWKKILYISVPSVGTNLLMSLSYVIVIKLLAVYGKTVVAGVGVSGRLESFGLLVPMALSSVIGPFVGQNWGAKKIDRIERGAGLSFIFLIIWGLLLLVLFNVCSEYLALLFSTETGVVKTIILYFQFVPFSYGFQGIFFTCCSIMNALKKPLHSSALHIFRIFFLYLPLAIIGSYFFQVKGIFIALMISNFISGLVAYLTFKKIIKRLRYAII